MNKTQRFLALLTQFGITFPEPKKAEPTSGRRLGFGISWNPLRDDDYKHTEHGIRRRFPKRDKSMTARQWRKFRRKVGKQNAIEHLRRLAARSK